MHNSEWIRFTPPKTGDSTVAMTVTMLHTAELHRRTFEELRLSQASTLALTHIVRPDLLRRAKDGIDAELEAEIASLIKEADGPVMCTCTTLGPIATRYGAMRADAPMMQAAAKESGDILLAYAVESTRDSSLNLLKAALKEADRRANIHVVSLVGLWSLFEEGYDDAFHAAVAGAITQTLKKTPDIGVVVLAQGSMAGAAGHLYNASQTVLTLPQAAFDQLLTFE